MTFSLNNKQKKLLTLLCLVGLVLFVMTLSLNIIGKWLVSKYSENY